MPSFKERKGHKMKSINYAKRNLRELVRDPLSSIFTLALPMLLLFVFKQINIPAESYRLENLTPGIVIFGFSFLTLFSAMQVAKDRTSSFLTRLAVSPMRAYHYISGYILSVLPLAALQNILFFSLALILGLEFSLGIILAALASIPMSLFFISLGIIIGSLFSERASSGMSSIVVQLVCFTGGMYFPRELLGDIFAKICELLPFESAVTIIKEIMLNKCDCIQPRNLIVITIYTLAALLSSSLIFKRRMLSDQ